MKYVETDKFIKFINDPLFKNYDSYKLGCYWYFREKNYQATTYEYSPVLIKKNLINIDPNNLQYEREQMYELLNITNKSHVLIEEKPLVHHYSWVRTKEEMLRKVKSWGHSGDTSWVS